MYQPRHGVVADVTPFRLLRRTGRPHHGEGSLGKLLNDPAFATSLTGTTQNMEVLTGKLNRGEGTMGKWGTGVLVLDNPTATWAGGTRVHEGILQLAEYGRWRGRAGW